MTITIGVVAGVLCEVYIMSVRGVLRIGEGGRLGFWCPGCEEIHYINTTQTLHQHARWTFNGDYDKPTFHPSVLVTSGHYSPSWQGPKCWCTYNAEHADDPAPYKCSRCHSWVRDGQIEFLSDSTHELAGMTAHLMSPDFQPKS